MKLPFLALAALLAATPAQANLPSPAENDSISPLVLGQTLQCAVMKHRVEEYRLFAANALYITANLLNRIDLSARAFQDDLQDIPTLFVHTAPLLGLGAFMSLRLQALESSYREACGTFAR